MIGLIILGLAFIALSYFLIDLFYLQARRRSAKEQAELDKVKPGTNYPRESRSGMILRAGGMSVGNSSGPNASNDALEDELLDMILELHPHIQIGNRMTAPSGVTYQGRNPTKEDYEAIESLGILQQVHALTKLEAVAFKIKLPFNKETIKNFELGDYKFIHPYQMTNMMPKNFEVGMQLENSVVTQEDYDRHNYVIFRCSFS